MIISRVLPDPANVGYDDVGNTIVIKANGRPIHSLAQFREAIKHPEGDFDVVRLLPGSGRGALIFDSRELKGINARIRQRYGIPDRPAGS